MRVLPLILVISGSYLTVFDARAQEAPEQGQSVTGILDGVVVGGTTRKSAGHSRDSWSNGNTSSHDSFAVGSRYSNQNNDEKTKHRAQSRSEIVPGLQGEPVPAVAVDGAAAPDSTENTGNQGYTGDNSAVAAGIANTISNATQNNTASSQYYRGIIDQVKSQAGNPVPPSGPSKYRVSDQDKF